jgi:thiol peroxidase
MERNGIVSMKGNPLTLTGPALNVGDTAPDFVVLDRDLKETGLRDFSGKIKIISVTPSLDTPVCDMQARRFNQDAATLPDTVIVLNISMDLPFAKVKAFSDHRDASFGNAYGVLVKDFRLLARAIFVIDTEEKIRYKEIVSELTDQPDYDKALAAVKQIIG